MPDDDAANLRAVRGIGPKAEARLKEAGVADLATLARTSASELAAALAGLPGKFDADRIDREKWITQAATLAASRSGADGPERDAVQLVRHGFTVEVRLRQSDHSVASMKIIHASTGDEDAWATWDPDRLIAFVRERSGLPPAEARPGRGPDPEQPEPAVSTAAPELPPAPEPSPGAGRSSGRVRAYAMVPASGPGSAGGRAHAVTAVLTFGRGQLSLAGPGPAIVRAEVLARQLLDGGSVVVGRGSATVDPAAPVRLDVPCDLSTARRPLVLCAMVRVLGPTGGERQPARELTGGRLLISS